MNRVVAATTGFGLGLAYFGGLWLSIRSLKYRWRSPARFAVGRGGRVALAGLVFFALLKTGGVVAVLAGLAGFVAARWYLTRLIEARSDAQ